MTAFTIVTGLITIIAFILQLAGAAPKYKKYLSHSVALFFGLTAGLLLNFSSQLHVTLPKEWFPRQVMGLLLYSATGILIFLLTIMGVLLEDPERRKSANHSTPAVSGFLIFALLFYWSAFF